MLLVQVIELWKFSEFLALILHHRLHRDRVSLLFYEKWDRIYIPGKYRIQIQRREMRGM